MGKLKTYWTVKTPITTLYYKEYKNAKEQSHFDYMDIPVKHTVKEEKFWELEKLGVFEEDKA